MDDKVRAMIRASVDSYINEDEEMAYKVCEKDDEIDAFYKSLFPL